MKQDRIELKEFMKRTVGRRHIADRWKLFRDFLRHPDPKTGQTPTDAEVERQIKVRQREGYTETQATIEGVAFKQWEKGIRERRAKKAAIVRWSQKKLKAMKKVEKVQQASKKVL